MKVCNMFNKTLRSVNDHLYKTGHEVHLWIDYSEFNQLKKVYTDKVKCRTEPGITLYQLNT